MRNEDFISFLREKSDPMPEYMIQILIDGAGQETYRTILEATLNYHSTEMYRASDFLIANMLTDTIQPDTITFDRLMNYRNSLYADMSIFELRLAAGNTSSAQQLLDLLGTGYELTDESSNELQLYQDLMQLQIDVLNDGRTLNELSEDEVVTIQDIASTSERMPGVIAENILNFFQGSSIDPIPLLPEVPAGGGKSRGTLDENVLPLVKSQLSAQPNPASAFVSFEYQLERAADAVVVVRDDKGSVVWQQKVTSQQGSLVWNTTYIKSGTYFYSLLQGNQHVSTGKLVILH